MNEYPEEKNSEERMKPRLFYLERARQTVKTLINEEAFLLAHYLRDEHETWSPRIASPA